MTASTDRATHRVTLFARVLHHILKEDFAFNRQTAERFRRGVSACDLLTSGPQLAEEPLASTAHGVVKILFPSGSPSKL